MSLSLPREPGTSHRTSLNHWPIVENKTGSVSMVNVNGECNVKGVITETKWKQKNNNSGRHLSHSGFFLKVFEKLPLQLGQQKLLSKLSPAESLAPGRVPLGPKLMASPLPLILPGGGWRKSLFIFCSYFVFKIYSYSSKDSFKSMTEWLFERQAVADGYA